MKCERCSWPMRPGLDGDMECLCGHVIYAHPPMDKPDDGQRNQLDRKIRRRVEGHHDGSVPSRTRNAYKGVK